MEKQMMDISTIDIAKVTKAGMVRFYGPLFVGKHIRQYIKPGNESSFTITSGSVSERPRPNWSVINSYATGLLGMTRGLALDLKPLRVNLVAP